ncbi:dna replication licensing factor mcm2 [Hordeum vulgare]|nr:dna replication licensing factor mcm2 [Hordeum vulgare]
MDGWMDVPGHPSVELEGQEVLDLEGPSFAIVAKLARKIRRLDRRNPNLRADGRQCQTNKRLVASLVIVGRHGVGRLVDGVGLAGELPLLDPEVRRDEPEDTHVGGDLVPYADHDDVPQDEVARGEGGRPLGVAEHGGVVELDLAQRLERLLGVGLLSDPDGGVDDEDEEDDERLDEGRERERAGRRGERERERDGAGDERDAYQRVLELLRHELQHRVPGWSSSSLGPCARRRAAATDEDSPRSVSSNELLRDRLPSVTEVLKCHGPGNGICPLCHVPETGSHILFSCVTAQALWCFVREALGPEWEAYDLADFLQVRATQVGCKRRLFWLVFAAMMWTLWTTRNKMVIEKVFQRRASDSFFKFLAFLQHWHPLVRPRDRNRLQHYLDALMVAARRLSSTSLAA